LRDKETQDKFRNVAINFFEEVFGYDLVASTPITIIEDKIEEGEDLGT
jgi:hypothetical protein